MIINRIAASTRKMGSGGTPGTSNHVRQFSPLTILTCSLRDGHLRGGGIITVQRHISVVGESTLAHFIQSLTTFATLASFPWHQLHRL